MTTLLRRSSDRMCSRVLCSRQPQIIGTRNPAVRCSKRFPAWHEIPHQRRQYPAASPRPRTGPTVEELFPSGSYPLEFFQNLHQDGAKVSVRLPAERYHQAVTEYSRKLRAGTGPHAVNLSDHGISAEEVYEAGCYVFHGLEKWSRWTAGSMWLSAGALGHTSAIICSALHIAESGKWGDVKSPTWIRQAEGRFARLVAAKPTPDSLFVEGVRLFKQENFTGAERHFRKALEAASHDFEWKAWCQLQLGRTFVKLGMAKEARSIFEHLFDEGFVEAAAEVGRAIRSTDRDEAQKWLQRATVLPFLSHGVMKELSELSWEKSREAKDPEERESAQRWAIEWSRLASYAAKQESKPR